MIIIYSCVYNSAATLPETIESVLQQSYKSFEFHIEDNGSTDETRTIVQDYANRDSRIVPHVREKNHRLTGEPPPIFTFTPPPSDYFTSIDGDDWWEPDYLECLLSFAEQYHLDIACTGTLMHHISTGSQGVRQMPHTLVLEKSQFSEAFPYYHAFFRPIWGKLFRTGLLSHIQLPHINFYGGDTLYSFQALRHANRIGIDSSVLHHYRIAKQSVSSQYHSERFESDVYLYNDAVDFLSAYGPVSARNRWFLQAVYANALSDTLGVIANAALSPAEKLKECRAIATHPLTRETYRENQDDSITRSRDTLLAISLQAGATLGSGDDGDLREITQTILPRCGGAVTKETVGLFLSDPEMRTALARDDADTLAASLLDLIEAKRYTKQYDLGKAIQALAKDKPPLRNVDDTRFLRKYRDIYWAVWQGRAAEALDTMTGLLLDGKLRGAEGTFLEVYLSLAAMENQEAAFLFGKTMLARLYLRRREREKCQAVLSELEEMGMEDNADLAAIRQGLAELK